MTDEGVVTKYRYDKLDRLLETVSDSKAMSYEYDKRGNIAKEYTDGLLQKTFTFDATNMLSKVVDAESGEATYSYNGMGKRVAVQNPTESIDYLLDLTKDYHNMLERTVNGESETYIYDSNVVSMSKAENDYFYMLDELGTGMYLTGTDGIATSTYAYDEFGRNINPFTGKKEKPAYTKQGNIIQPLAFTGYQRDEMTESYFAQARYYDAKIARFISRDKERYIWFSKSKSLNIYEYCYNRPIDRIDLNGHYTFAEGVEAHLMMEAYALEELAPNCSVEYPIEGGSYHGSGNYGYADIVIFNDVTAEIYEIKPGSYAEGAVNHAIGEAQLNGYVDAFNNIKLSNLYKSHMDEAIVGTSYDATFNNVAIPSVINEGEYIVYRTYGDGLIIYNYQKSIPDDCKVYEPEPKIVLSAAANYMVGMEDSSVYNARIAFEIGLALGMIDAMAVMLADDATVIGLADEPALAATFVAFCMLLGVIYIDSNYISTDGNDCVA